MEQRDENLKEQIAAENSNDKAVTADFFAIFHDVLKNLWMVILVGISVAFLAYVWSYVTYHPQYVSRTTFVVSAKGSNVGAYANLSQTQRLAEVFKTVLDSDVLKKKVAEQLQKDSFEGTVSVSIVPETNLLSVSVTADSPTTAFQQLNTMLEQYPSVSQNVLGDVVLEVFEAPNYPASPSVVFQGDEMMKRGFLVGAAAMIVLFALVSYFKDTVKNEKEVEIKLDTTLCASVYHESKYKNIRSFLKRERKKIWLTEPAVSFGFGETIKAYMKSDTLDVADLKYIPLVFAGWLRYLMAVDDNGTAFDPSPDPLLSTLRPVFASCRLGDMPQDLSFLDELLSNESIWGVNLFSVGLADLVKDYFQQLTAGPGAVKATLEKYLG